MIKAGQIRGLEAAMSGLQEFAYEAGRVLMDECLMTGRVLSTSLARSTQPYGTGTDAKRMGEQAVERDIRKVFTTPSAMYAALKEDDPKSAAEFWSAWRNRDQATMRKVMSATDHAMPILATAAAEMHQAARRRYGRVPGKGARPKAMVASSRALNEYIKTVQARVGTAKSGWANAADACGGSGGLPSWITRHPKRSGDADITRDPLKPLVVIHNNVPWAREALPQDEEETAVRIADDRLRKRMTIVLRKMRRKGR